MKKLILILALATLAWHYQQRNLATSDGADIQEEDVIESEFEQEPLSQTPQLPQFTCDGRQHCSQMRSFAEAEFFLKNCPNTKMDGDHDGIPCERQFGL
ncbi:excalibur calcium-binding domain-containing protein [Shewanella sedimentimangrovi]|uniref:Excalibur calcium-binding domain-containing protein n=1 Tax=Shewanella sedimentimangrovi TaxID=2814293 RepID=A0ABX7QYV1_9GAMM|nr:excalibur calcium-binding domain-containing protein [Shewanella sedimentimangrovi]